MVHNNIGKHHYHQRRGLQLTSPKVRAIIDKGVYVVTVFGILITLPQILKIWVGKNATGVSALSWAGYMLIAFFWLTYGIAHKSKPIIVSNIGWLFLQIFIIIGTLIYG